MARQLKKLPFREPDNEPSSNCRHQMQACHQRSRSRKEVCEQLAFGRRFRSRLLSRNWLSKSHLRYGPACRVLLPQVRVEWGSWMWVDRSSDARQKLRTRGGWLILAPACASAGGFFQRLALLPEAVRAKKSKQWTSKWLTPWRSSETTASVSSQRSQRHSDSVL